MEPSSQQQQSLPTQGQQTSNTTTTAARTKNLSIKDFFTNRLMRAKSFEGGGANSPKDETSNWFDEFKARMKPKSSNKQNVNNNSGTPSATVIEDDELIDSAQYDVQQTTSTKHKHNRNKNSDDSCDSNYLENLSEVGEELLTNNITQDDCAIQSSIDDTSTTTRSPLSGLRKRKKQLISCSESPDFDRASINTIFNRKDSRYEQVSRKSYRKFFSSIVNTITWCISYTIPFNYNLPWKLLSLINFTFVIIVIGLTSETKPELTAFTFFNGFVSGLLIATLCFIILMLSLIVKLLPKKSVDQQDTSLLSTKSMLQQTKDFSFRKVVEQAQQAQQSSISKIQTNTLESTFDNQEIDNNTESLTSNTKAKIVDDFSTFEVLENKPTIEQNATMETNPLDDDDYKGWMIEFIGDYELRNKADFKLKLIYVRIENRILHLCKPKNSHDAESTAFPVFVQQRIYNLETAVKFSANLLLPKNVKNRQKWVWSKKYPIRLEFQDDINSTIQPQSKSTDGNVCGSSSISSSGCSMKTIQLTLFARSCREKEEWFRRFKRIVEENKFALNHKRFSFQSNLSGSNNEESLGFSFNSLKNFRTNSPSVSSKKSSSVHGSKSSHLIHDLRRIVDGKTTSDNSNKSNLSRTKSCELLNVDQQQQPSSSSTSVDQSDLEQNELVKNIVDCVEADDSTLTKETAEVFSQAVEYSNFIESQPKLSYKEYIEKVIESGQYATTTSDWFNALTGRIFFDVFSRDYWSIWFKRKIQRKLYRIRLPYFMETLTLSTIDLGTNAPQFLNVVSHSFDSFGLSIDFDMTYSGGLTMTFETKLNLLKIKNDNSNSTSSSSPNNNSNTANQSTTITSNVNLSSSAATSTSSTNNNINNYNNSQQNQPSSQVCENLENNNNNNNNNIDSKINSESSYKQGGKLQPTAFNSSGSTRTSGESSDSYDSDSDSSSDSSCDEADVDEISDWEDYGAEKTRQSIVRFVDKIASSRYFQHATENRYIKKKLQDISNCPLVLIVQIQSLSGILTLNVPPPQTDRIWYGFKPNPELTLKALPKMGDREVNLSHVTDWIEKKLAEEFRKILVIPNMEDIVLPVLKSDHLLYVTTTK